MSFTEYFNGLSALGKSFTDGLNQDEAAKLLDQQLSTALAAQGQQAAAPGNALAALGQPVSRSLPAFVQGGGDVGDYLAQTRARESGGNDAAKNPNSTATGRYQFTGGTWNGLARKYPDLGLTPDGRTDPAQQERAMQAFTHDNAQVLSSKGIPINPTNLYGAHFLGAGGAASFIPAAINNPDAPAVSLAPQAAAANRSVFFNRDGSPKSAGEVYAWMGGPAAPRAPAAAPTLPPGASGLNPALASRGGAPQLPAPAPQASGGRAMTMPDQAQAEPDAANMPAPNAVPTGFRILPAGQPAPSDFVPGSVASPAIAQPSAPAAPASLLAPAAAQRLSTAQADNLRAMLRNPLTQPYAAKIVEGLNKPDEFSFQVVGDQLVRTSKSGRAEVVPNIVKPAALQAVKGSDGNDYTFNPQTGQWFRATEGKEKTFTDVTDPQARKAAGVPDWYTGTVQRGPDNHVTYPGAGQQGVTPQQKLQNSAEQKLSENEVQQVIDARDAAKAAGQKLQTLAVLSDAWKNSGGNISTGPGAETVLKAKQIAKNLGVDLGGVPESEIVSKVGTQLAAQTAKDLTSRPTQFDFAVMLQNNPGLLISEQGNKALINIGQQQAKRELQIAALARKYKYGEDWGATLDQFERAHPILSPLTGKPLDPNEVMFPGPQGPDGGAPQRGGSPQAGLRPMDADVLGEARAAIRAGKPAAAVMQRLREHGFDPGGL